MSDPTPIIETQRKDTPMILTPNDTLYHCEACEGYALVRLDSKTVRVTPCQCQFEEEDN